MTEVKYETIADEPAAFNLYLDGDKIGEMIVETQGTDITVFHTEVDEDKEGKGYAGEILAALVAYARKEKLKVVPMCAYVRAQFDRHPDEYKDIRSESPAKF
jgi:predicted GNAT family acetyltransferase